MSTLLLFSTPISAQSLLYHSNLNYNNIYYVDPAFGVDDDLHGTLSDPFMTLTYAMEKSNQYDIIILRNGEYKEDHDSNLHSDPKKDCNIDSPEAYPIYWKNDVTIQAFLISKNPLLFESAVLTTAENCNSDIIRPLHADCIFQDKWKKWHQGKWSADSDPLYSQIIGVTFKTNPNYEPNLDSG